MKITIDTSNFNLKKVASQIDYATSQAINSTMFEAKSALRDDMIKHLDNPTRFTLSSHKVTKATKKNLTGTIEVEAKRSWYLQYVYGGGTRTPKNKAMRMPTKYAKLNKYGNLPRNKVNTLLKNRKKYFSGKPLGGNRRAGVYERTRRGLKPLIMWDDKFTYDKQLDFYSVVRETFRKNFNKNFNVAFMRAMETAR